MTDDIVDRLKACETRSLVTMSDDTGQLARNREAWVELWQCLQEAACEIKRLREVIRRLSDQDATLSVVGGDVIVQMDFTLTDEEREAIELASGDYLYHQDAGGRAKFIRQAMLGLLARLGGAR